MYLKVVCAWCGKFLGIKPGGAPAMARPPVTHGICCECKRKLEEETETLLHETTTIYP